MEIFHQNITILIQDMAGGVIPIEIGPETKVRDVKWLLRAINGVSVWRQCLTVMHSDEDYVILDDTHTVSSSRVADGATVYVVVATFDSILADFVRNHPPANGITVGWFPVIFQDIMHETASNFFHPGFAKWIHLRFLDDWLKTGYTNFVGDQRDQRQTWLLVFYWFYMTFSPLAAQ